MKPNGEREAVQVIVKSFFELFLCFIATTVAMVRDIVCCTMDQPDTMGYNIMTLLAHCYVVAKVYKVLYM